jgi:hypothetical protein
LFKVTKASIDKPSNIDMYNQGKANVRGGVVLAREKRPKGEMAKFDVNSMYWKSQRTKIYVGGDRYEDISELIKSQESVHNYILNYDDSTRGMRACVDIYCPKALHRKYLQFPLLPSNIVVTDDMLNPEFQKALKKRCGITSSCSRKLTPTLLPQKAVEWDYQALQYAVAHGWRITRLHYVVTYDHIEWMCPFVDLNIAGRVVSQEKKEKFRDTLYKITGHAGGFGKFAENPCKHTQAKVLFEDQLNAAMMTRLESKTKGYNVFPGCKMVLRQNHVVEREIDRNLIIALTILDRSKVIMWEFLDVLFAVFPDARLAYTDTDSVLVCNLPLNWREIVLEHPELYSLMDCSENTDILKKSEGAKEIGLFKDEMKGERIADAVCLNAKCYSIITEADQRAIKAGKTSAGARAAKGVHKGLLKSLITHDDFVKIYEAARSLDTAPCMQVRCNQIKSTQHMVKTQPNTKRALAFFDDKLYVISPDLCVPYGTDREVIIEECNKRGIAVPKSVYDMPPTIDPEYDPTPSDVCKYTLETYYPDNKEEEEKMDPNPVVIDIEEDVEAQALATRAKELRQKAMEIGEVKNKAARNYNNAKQKARLNPDVLAFKEDMLKKQIITLKLKEECWMTYRSAHLMNCEIAKLHGITMKRNNNENAIIEVRAELRKAQEELDTLQSQHPKEIAEQKEIRVGKKCKKDGCEKSPDVRCMYCHEHRRIRK